MNPVEGLMRKNGVRARVEVLRQLCLTSFNAAFASATVPHDVVTLFMVPLPLFHFLFPLQTLPFTAELPPLPSRAPASTAYLHHLPEHGWGSTEPLL